MISKLLASAAVLALSVGAGQAWAQQATVGAGAHANGAADSARGSTAAGAGVTTNSSGTAPKAQHSHKAGDPVTSTLGHTGGLIGSTVGGNLGKGAGLIGSTVGGALGVGRHKPQPQPQS